MNTETYTVVYSGGVTARSNPDLESPALGIIPVNSVIQVKNMKVDEAITYLQLVNDTWVVSKKGPLVTCMKEVIKRKKFKVAYGGGCVIRNAADLNAAPTGRTLPHGFVFEVARDPIPTANNNLFLELGDGSGFVICRLNGKEVCVEANEAFEEANRQYGLSGASRVGQHTMMRIPPDLCGDTAAASILYEPPNPTYQISKLGHYTIFRKGIWNDTIIQSNASNTVTSAGGVAGSNIVYSVEGLPIKLSDAAVAKIKHAYNGEPLLITLKTHAECCSPDCCEKLPCCQLACLDGCNFAYAYSDDAVIVNGIWFGKKDAVPVPTFWSSMGCMCFVPRQIQLILSMMLFRPPSACSEMCANCECCPSPPLINQIFIDAYDCKVITDHARLTDTGKVLEEERKSLLPGAFAETMNTLNPLLKNQ